MEPFKNWVNKKTITIMAQVFKRLDPLFKEDEFIKKATFKLNSLELKARTLQVAHTLYSFLPQDFSQACYLIQKSLSEPLQDKISGSEHNEQGIGGWSTMILADYVALYGQDHLEVAINTLQQITRRGSAEFAIRHFLLSQQDKTLALLKAWVNHPDHHVRRLVSEGTRPRLPWGFQLPSFIENPRPLIPLLKALKDDESEYVRRSVANNLNDIAKDHPDLVCQLTQEWMNLDDKNSVRLFRHACRTLLKKDYAPALALFGYTKPKVQNLTFSLSHRSIKIGDSLELALSFTSQVKQDLMIDYVVHHQKANGKTAPKVFKWRKQAPLKHDELVLSKKHSFKPVTTRVYYPGIHLIDVKINGETVAQQSFELLEA